MPCHGCGVELVPGGNWYHDDEARGQRRCVDCKKRDNDWINAVSRIAYAIAGGSKRFYALPKADRSALREHAKRLHEAGSTYVSAVHNEQREKDGFIYAVTNPAFPGCVKVGSALNPESRLADFQTGCPYRGYVLQHFVYASDRRAGEAMAHEMLADRRLEGEWFLVSVAGAKAVLDEVAEYFELEDVRRAFLSRAA